MHTDKPQSLSVRDYIIRRISPQLRQPEEIISAVVSHEYSSANAATKLSREVEISGLGKFMFSDRKGIKRLEKLHSIKEAINNILTMCPEDKIASYHKKIEGINEEIVYIENKINQKKVNELD